MINDKPDTVNPYLVKKTGVRRNESSSLGVIKEENQHEHSLENKSVHKQIELWAVGQNPIWIKLGFELFVVEDGLERVTGMKGHSARSESEQIPRCRFQEKESVFGVWLASRVTWLMNPEMVVLSKMGLMAVAFPVIVSRPRTSHRMSNENNMSINSRRAPMSPTILRSGWTCNLLLSIASLTLFNTIPNMSDS